MSDPKTKFEKDVDLSAFSKEEREIAERLMNPPPRPVPASESADKATLERLGQLFEETA